MAPRKYKLIGFYCESLGTSKETPACEDVRLIARLTDENGWTIERTRTILAYPRIMADAEQYSSLLAAELRSMMAGTQGS